MGLEGLYVLPESLLVESNASTDKQREWISIHLDRFAPTPLIAHTYIHTVSPVLNDIVDRESDDFRCTALLHW